MFHSLDGVMQAPGGPTEDWTGGFTHGGWIWHFGDEVIGDTLGNVFVEPYELLLGRKTWEIFAAYWPFYKSEGGEDEDGGIAEQFNRIAKHVLTANPGQPLDWANSHRLADIDAVAALKQSAGPDLVIQGSTTLYPQLLAAGLIDRLVVMTYPIVLGGGKRLFGEGTPSLALSLVDHKVSSKGVIVATYEPAGKVPTGSFGSMEPSAPEVARQERMKREG